MPNTTKNIIWFDLDTERVKIAKHAKFDEGMNDLPITELPPNTTYSQRSKLGQPFPEDKYDLTTSDFDFVISPFDKTLTKAITVSCNKPTFGINLQSDEISNRVFIKDIQNKSSVAKSLNYEHLPKNKRRQIRGAYITAINGVPIFDKGSALKEFKKLRNSINNGEINNFTIDISPLPRNPAKTMWKECEENNILVPDP